MQAMTEFKWEVIPECNDDEGNPTVWAMELKYGGAKQGYYYITKDTDENYHVDFEGYAFRKRSSFKTLSWAMKVCRDDAIKSLKNHEEYEKDTKEFNAFESFLYRVYNMGYLNYYSLSDDEKKAIRIDFEERGY